ncbi:MAG: SGNH/GDSL hydrolase family protein [Phycisphaerae bacterium]|nr:SGNH/GDSL hydrolase family protein [Phycisphaerae bacterium]
MVEAAGTAWSDNLSKAAPREIPFGSNAVRLSPLQWIIAGAVVFGSFYLVPSIWARFERFETGPDFRMPYQLSYDYWLYARACEIEADRGKTLVVGDSVVWGQYVAKDQTLSHYLNKQAGKERFANLGVDGSHPAALGGLVGYYGWGMSGNRVILQYNPLWMTSEKHDLQTTKEFRFNHPRLVPQFRPLIACYTASRNDRIGIVVERHIPLLSWANHVRMTYFENQPLAGWTLERPYANPLSAVTMEIPASSKKVEARPLPWDRRGMDRADFAWVGLDTSVQWRSFRETVELLRDRACSVFVIVGPFNEHMLKGESVAKHARLKRDIAAWLAEQDVPHIVPPTLPSELYADASHPLGEGYALLAKEVYRDPGFVKFDGR